MNNFSKSVFAAVAAVAMAAAGCDNADKYLRIDPEHIDIDSDVPEATASIEASAAWMAYCSADWLTYSYWENTLIIGIPTKNESLLTREASITIITGDGQTRVLPVLQKAMDAFFDITPASLGEFGSNGETSQTLTVSTNLTDWGSSAADSWVTVVRGTGEIDANVLTITVEQSRQLGERESSVTVSPALEAFESLARTIPVVQRGVELMIASTLLNSSTYVLEVPAEETEAVITVYAKEMWEVATDDTGGRIVPNLTGGPADTESGTVLTITVPENTGTEPYNYLLTFTCGGEVYEYEMVQAAP